MGFGLTFCDYTEKRNINNLLNNENCSLVIIEFSCFMLHVPLPSTFFLQDMGTTPIISPLSMDSSDYMVLLKNSKEK